MRKIAAVLFILSSAAPAVAPAQPAAVLRDLHCGGVFMADAEEAKDEAARRAAVEKAAVFIRRAQDEEPLLDIDELVDEEMRHALAAPAAEREKARADCAKPSGK